MRVTPEADPSQAADGSAEYRTQVVHDLGALDRVHWDRLVAADPDANPFVSYDVLDALHASGCASPRTGWAPHFVLAWRGPELVAAAPLYLKGHSYGEYVFDWAWAEASERAGLAYYPKWLVAVPFTPVTGSRLLATDAPARAALAGAVAALAAAGETSSLHVLFAPDEQVEALRAHGALVRRSLQFHWQAAGDADFEAFLARLAQPKRKKIRAERRKVAEAGVTVERRVGTRILEADWRFFHRCYRATYAAHGSVPYLTLDFFLRLARSLPQHLMMVIARRAGRPIAAALGVWDGRTLYGRHWGTLEAVPCLHFECCYYQMIEFAIERGLASFEGGAQGQHKLARGLEPQLTASAHWITEPRLREAVARAIAREADHLEEAVDELNERRPFRAGPDGAEGGAEPN